MLNEYPKAVRLALTTGMTVESQKLANRPRNELQRKQLWMMIAEELLVEQMKSIEDKEGIEFRMKTKESLKILLQSSESCLDIEDILPLLHPKTKMREIKNYLA